MQFRVEPRGKRVVVWRGPAKTTYQYADEEEALEAAEQFEAEFVADQEHRLAQMAKYGDKDHPADPVMPHPAEIERARAELDALASGDPLPDPVDPVDVPDAGTPEADALVEEAAVAAKAAADPGDEPEPSVDLDYDDEDDKVVATMHNPSGQAVKVVREVTDAEGNVVRKGDVELEPGRKLSRRYALDDGQTIRFSTSKGVALADMSIETTTDDDGDE